MPRPAIDITPEHAMDNKKIIQSWLQYFSDTANSGDHERHLAMVSEQLLVFGVSRKGFLDYTEWMKRRHNDLKQGRLLRMNYRNIDYLPVQDGRLAFTVEETLKTTNGDTFIINKTMTLARENDKWLLCDERIRSVHSMTAPGLETSPPSPL